MKLLVFILELIYIFRSRSFSSFSFILLERKLSVSSIIESYNHLKFDFKIARNDPSLLWDFYISKEIERRLRVIQAPYVNMVCIEFFVCKYRLPFYYSLINITLFITANIYGVISIFVLIIIIIMMVIFQRLYSIKKK